METECFKLIARKVMTPGSVHTFACLGAYRAFHNVFWDYKNLL